MNKTLLIGAALRIGDVVEQTDCNDRPYGTAYSQMVVINKTDDEITFFRPYVSLSNFTYTGGAIPYIGVNQFTSPTNHPMKYVLIDNIYRGV
jgi:hypothetical protein